METHRRKLTKQSHWIDDEYYDKYARVCGWKATIVYQALCRYSNKDQYCFPKIRSMAEQLGVTADTIIAGIKKLEEYKIILKNNVRSKTGVFKNNAYILLDKSVWSPLPDRLDTVEQEINQYDNAELDKDPIITEENDENTTDQFDTIEMVKEENTINRFDPIESVEVVDNSLTNSMSSNPPIRPRRTIQFGHVEHKGTHNKGTHVKDTPIIPLEGDESLSEVDKQVNQLIRLFAERNINPTINFTRRSYRKKTEEFIEKIGFEFALQACEYAIEIQGQDFAPSIVSPWECCSKFGNLITFFKKQHQGEQPYFLQESNMSFNDRWRECVANCGKCFQGYLYFQTEEGSGSSKYCDCVEDLLTEKKLLVET